MVKDSVEKILQSKYNYYQNIILTSKNEQNKCSISDFFLHNATLIQSAIDRGINKICLTLPTDIDSIIWLPLLLALNQLKTNCNTFNASNYSYNEEDKILYKNKIILKVVSDDTHNIKVWAPNQRGIKNLNKKTKGGEAYLSIKDKLYIQPIKTVKGYSLFKQFIETRKYLTRSVIDKLLNIESYSNCLCFTKTILIITENKKFSKLQKFLLNDCKFSDLFVWAKWVYDRKLKRYDLKPIGSIKKQGTPTITITSDLPKATLYINKYEKNISLICIDGLEKIIRHRSDFDIILEKKIPTIVISHIGEINNFKIFDGRNFLIPIWPYEELVAYTKQNEEIKQNFYFESKTSSINNVINKSIEIIECHNEQLDSLVNSYVDIKNHFKLYQDPIFKRIKSLIFILTSSLSKLICPPNETWLKDRYENIQELESIINRSVYKCIIDEAIDKKITVLIDIMKLILKTPPDEKIEIISKQLTNTKTKILILTSKFYDIKSIKKYWSNRHQSNYEICEINYCEKVFKDFDEIWITGYFNKTIMKKIITSGGISNIKLILYEHEKNFLKSSCGLWIDQDKFHQTSSHFKLFSKCITEKIITLKHIEQTTQKPYFSIPEKHKEEITKKKKLFNLYTLCFSNNSFIIAKPKHFFYIANPFFCGTEVKEIPQKITRDLVIGDYVIMRESESDIIKSRVDKELEDENNLYLRETANKWKKPLEQFIDREWKKGQTFTTIVKKLQEKGLSQNKQTIIQWLFNENRIGPRKIEDLKVIAQITGDQDLKDNIHEIQDAITCLRNKHLNAFNNFSKLFSEKFFEIAQNTLKNNFKSNENYRINIEDIGTINILYLKHIEQHKEFVDSINLNKLFTWDQYKKSLPEDGNIYKFALINFENELFDKISTIKNIFSNTVEDNNG